MCLWLLTACLGLLPSNPSQQSQIVIIQGIPTPILQPTTAATTATTGMPPPTNATMMTTRAPNATTPMPPGPTPGPTMAPTSGPTMAPTPAPTMPPTMAPTPASTMPPTMAPTPAPTMAPTSAPTMATTPGPTMAPTTAAPTPTTPRPTTGNTIIPTFQTDNIVSSSSTPNTLTTPFNITSTQPTIIANNSSDDRTYAILLCDNPDVICVSNPDDNTTGQLPIDPRLGTTTQGPSAAFRLPAINGYSAQSPPDSAVRFPRERRSVNNIKNSAQYIYENYYSPKHRIRKRQSCRCVPAGTCVKPSYGSGMIDIRIVTPTAMPCPSGKEYCCGNTTSPIACGTLQTSPAPVVAPSAGQANYGEYPWQAIILTKQNDYIAGGVLIDQLNVITVTHRLSTYIVAGKAPNVKVRLGEWDAAGTYEPIPFQEYDVSKVFTHPQFDPNTLQYDIMVLRLASSVPLTPMMGAATTINRACLPPSATTTYTGQRCSVAGWGKDMFGMQGQYQQILKKVDVPIVAPATCQSQMQTARLGSTFVLDTTSFICAGGEANKDSCTGDGGSGLVCQVNNQWVVVGLVAWGLGCANANVPAAYVNVAAFLPWIQQQVATA